MTGHLPAYSQRLFSHLVNRLGYPTAKAQALIERNKDIVATFADRRELIAKAATILLAYHSAGKESANAKA